MYSEGPERWIIPQDINVWQVEVTQRDQNIPQRSKLLDSTTVDCSTTYTKVYDGFQEIHFLKLDT